MEATYPPGRAAEKGLHSIAVALYLQVDWARTSAHLRGHSVLNRSSGRRMGTKPCSQGDLGYRTDTKVSSRDNRMFAHLNAGIFFRQLQSDLFSHIAKMA